MLVCSGFRPHIRRAGLSGKLGELRKFRARADNSAGNCAPRPGTGREGSENKTMQIEWEDERTPSVSQAATGATGEPPALARLDALLPTDPVTGATTALALRCYLAAMMEMAARKSQPLALIALAVDDCPILDFLGEEGAALIGRAMARCLRQETRAYDVAGRASDESVEGIPGFVIVCPLMDEVAAVALAERMRAVMTAHAAMGARPWLTLSLGVAGMALDTTTPDALLSRAESALRRARRQGGGRVWGHSDTLRQIVHDHDTEPESPPEARD